VDRTKAEDDRPLLLVGRYEVGELIGRGGMADVHRAHDLTLDRPVAVKLLRESAGDDSDRARFMLEARTLAGLSHSGLVTVLDAGVDDATTTAPEAQQPFLVMELVEGPTLAQEISSGSIPLDRVGSIGVQVGEALDYVHGHGVVHRDVKPGNVLLGDGERVRLADFGVARLVDAARHTRTGQLVGTVAYLAPEQVTGGDATQASDVYALGLVLLESLTGEREYAGPPTEAALARLSRPPRIPPDLPPMWQRLLDRMTSLDPAERPSAREVAEELRSQPTGPIPVATERHPDAVEVPLLAREVDAENAETSTGTQSTRVMTGTAPTVDLSSQREGPVLPPAATGPTGAGPLPDRAGDALARQPAQLAARLRALPSEQKGLLGALAALVLLIAIVAVAGNADDPQTEVPDNIPTELQEPLGDLHEAVNED
jgi:serine/threonine protein kinase